MVSKIPVAATNAKVQGWVSALLDSLYPPRCVACGHWGEWLCTACIDGIPSILPPICRQCGRPLSLPGICRDCEQKTSQLFGMRSVSPHAPPLREAIHALKYEGVRVLSGPLGDVLASYWWRASLPVHVIVPVPLHKARLRQRGYNQSLLLARSLGERIGIPLEEDALVRERDTRSQIGLSREERWTNVWGAFRCRFGGLRGANVLLIDDVLTTGATLEASSAALLEAGVRGVWSLTLTRGGASASMMPPARRIRISPRDQAR